MDNATRRLQVPASPLSEAGEHQARLLAERLASLPVARMLCSDYQRARQTAEMVHGKLTRSAPAPEVNIGLRERNFGDLRGQRYEDVSVDLFDEGFAPPNGETWQQFDLRIAKTWQSILRETDPNDDKHTLLVTHGLVCRSIVKQFAELQQSLPDAWHNTSVTVMTATAPHCVEALNDASHLAHLERGAQV